MASVNNIDGLGFRGMFPMGRIGAYSIYQDFLPGKVATKTGESTITRTHDGATGAFYRFSCPTFFLSTDRN
jgi:hypothetical protein